MSAKKLADFIFEGTGKGVNYAMRKLGLSKSEIEGLSPNQLKMRIAEKGKGSYKGRTKAKNMDTGKLTVGASALAVLANVWDEIDPTKIKKMGDGTLRAEDKRSKPKGITKKRSKPPEPPKKRPDSIKSIPANRTEKQTRGQVAKEKKKNGVTFKFIKKKPLTTDGRKLGDKKGKK